MAELKKSKLYTEESERLAKKYGCKVNQGGTWTDLKTGWPIPLSVTDALVNKSLELKSLKEKIYDLQSEIEYRDSVENEEW